MTDSTVLHIRRRRQRPAEDVLLKVPEVADRFGVSVSTVRRWIRHGLIPHVRLSAGIVRIPVKHLEQFTTDRDLVQREEILRQKTSHAGPPRPSGVYFLQAGEEGPIKIGHSVNVLARLKEIQATSAEPLRLLSVREGDQQLESRLHLLLDAYRIHHEWFQPVVPVLEEVFR